MKLFQVLVFAALLLAAAAGAADPKYVALNVVALDSKGQPVADLTSADFQISDNGKPQEIAFFHLTPLKNRDGGVFPHTTLILFDLLNSAMSDRGFSSAEIARNLQGLETSDSLYFYLLTKDAKLFPVRALPNGPADMKPESTPWTKKIKPLLDDALQKVNKLKPGDHLIDTTVKQTYAALETVVSTLAMMPGRNSLIWISHGVPISVRLVSDDDEVKYTPLLKRLVTDCDRGRTLVYTVDPSGVALTTGVSMSPTETVRLPNLNGGIASGPLSVTPTTDIAMASAETMTSLSNLTGAVAYRGDDVAAATRLAMSDTRANYRIEYVLPAEGWDGKLHKLKVTTGRKGVNLQVKQSFYADAPGEGELDRAAMQTAVSAPFDNPEIGLRVTASQGKAPGSTRFRLMVDPADTLLVHQGDTYLGQMDVAFVQFTDQGPKSVSTPIIAKVTLTQAQYDTALKAGIPVDEEVAVGADIRKVRAIVYDRGSGLTGSLTVPVGSQ